MSPLTIGWTPNVACRRFQHGSISTRRCAKNAGAVIRFPAFADALLLTTSTSIRMRIGPLNCLTVL